MTRWKLHLSVLALVAAAGTVLVGATPAAADPPGLVRASTTSAASSADKTVTQLCPGGTVVTGGGGYLTAPAAAHEGLVALDRLEPLGNGSGFVAAMREAHPDPANWQLTVDALCAPQPPGYIVRANTGGAGVSAVSVSCQGATAIGAGAKVNNGNGHVVLQRVAPTTDHASVLARADVVFGSSASGWTVTAYAVCATVSVRPLVVASNGPTSAATATVSAACPAGSALYGIGAEVSPASGRTFLDLVHAIDVHHVSARASEDAVAGNPAAWTVTTYGICAN